jgi:hypothetical protein
MRLLAKRGIVWFSLADSASYRLGFLHLPRSAAYRLSFVSRLVQLRIVSFAAYRLVQWCVAFG